LRARIEFARIMRDTASVHHETRYARSGDVNIAYQVLGEGPRDLVFVSGWVSHLEYQWEEPAYAAFLERLASFSRLILFDKRGTGLSDRVPSTELPTLEQRMDDVRAVMDAVGSEQAALLGVSEGGPMCLLFGATYPERTTALVVFGSYARRLWAADYPFGQPLDEYNAFTESLATEWGGPVGLALRAPSRGGDVAFSGWWSTFLRMSASPGAAVTLMRMNGEIDVRHVLAVIQAPTLIVHRTGDRTISAEGARYMAERIAGARYVELPGDDHLRRGGGVPDRRPPRSRAGPDSRDRALHRPCRVDRARGRARRQAVARPAGDTPHGRPARAPPIPRERGRHRR
jgi:pimeloyl-ACP methyl ester carboxylesterase